MSKELIRLSNCTMAFDGDVVLDNINLYINDQEFLTLLGPSGCGKTTTLRIIGGFQTPTQGDVFFDGVRINDVPPHKRAINTVFQRYALFPHLNVFEISPLVCASPRRTRRPSARSNCLSRRSMTGSWRCSTWSTSTDLRSALYPLCPADSSSVWPSPALWSTGPRSCCWDEPLGPGPAPA